MRTSIHNDIATRYVVKVTPTMEALGDQHDRYVTRGPQDPPALTRRDLREIWHEVNLQDWNRREETDRPDDYCTEYAYEYDTACGILHVYATACAGDDFAEIRGAEFETPDGEVYYMDDIINTK